MQQKNDAHAPLDVHVHTVSLVHRDLRMEGFQDARKLRTSEMTAESDNSSLQCSQ